MPRAHLRRKPSQVSLQSHSSATTTTHRRVRLVAKKCKQRFRHMCRKKTVIEQPHDLLKWEEGGKIPGIFELPSEKSILSSPLNDAKPTSLLDLPYELREQIYLCVHKLSCVYKAAERSRPIWTCLASSCHQIRNEMRDIPLRYLLGSTKQAWIDTGAKSPLLVTTSNQSYIERNVTVLVPRCILEFNDDNNLPSHVHTRCLTVLSALLHIHTNRVVLSIYDDGTPPLNHRGHNMAALSEYLDFILDLLCARRFRRKDRYVRHSPMRQAGHMRQMKVVNTKEVVLLWPSLTEPDFPFAHWWTQNRIQPWTIRRGGNIPQCFTFSGDSFPWDVSRMTDTHDDMQRVAVTSSTGFRPKRQLRKALKVELLPSQVFCQRFLST
jgi:hypothetical protein